MENYTKIPRTIRTTYLEQPRPGSTIALNLNPNIFVFSPANEFQYRHSYWEQNDVVFSRWTICVLSDDLIPTEEIAEVLVNVPSIGLTHRSKIINNSSHCNAMLPTLAFEGVFKLGNRASSQWVIQLPNGNFEDADHTECQLSIMAKGTSDLIRKYKVIQETSYLGSIEDSKIVVKV